MTCKYTHLYDNESKTFVCNELCYRDDYCIFHLKGYLDESTIRHVEQSFEEKIRDFDADELLCVGYTLPSLSPLIQHIKKNNCKIYFDNVTFKYGIDLPDVTFTKNMLFKSCTFQADVNFNSSIFTKNMSFKSSTFQADVNFGSSIFKNDINFNDCKFCNKSSFSGASFEKLAKFTNATFSNKADFNFSIFNKIDFNYSEFIMDVDFIDNTFNDDANFNDVKFLQNADFGQSKFLSSANFEKTQFMKFANFSNILFSSPQNVKFNTDLSNVGFIDTNIKLINFGTNTSWKINSTLACKKTDDKFIIYDELKILEQTSIQKNLESVKNIYRDLRDNFDQNLQYRIAGEFFVREMELTRCYKQDNDKIKLKSKPARFFSFYMAYKILGQYGQSCKRPFLWNVGLMLSAFCIFIHAQYSESNMLTLTMIVKTLSDTLSILVPLNYSPNDYVANIFKISSLPISAVFFIALKRKLERKLRH